MNYILQYVRPQDTLGTVVEALRVIGQYGGISEEHHKAWVIDQVVRALTGEGYEDWVKAMKLGLDGPDSYDWDTGIAP